MRRNWVAVGFLTLATVFGGVVSAHTVNVSGGLNVRTGPGYGYSIIAVLANGTVVNTIGTSGAWTHIDSPKTGWVYSAYLLNTPHSGTTSGTRTYGTHPGGRSLRRPDHLQ